MAWWVWVLLVAGTLVGAFFLGRSLWRRAVALGRALGAASRVFAEASERISVAVEEAQANAAPTGPSMFDDPTVLRERVAEQRRARASRAVQRRARQWGVARTWSLDGWLAARQAGQRR